VPTQTTPSRLPRWAVRLLVATLPVLLVAGVAGAAVLAQDDPAPDDALVAAQGLDAEAALAAVTTTTPPPATTVPVPVTTTEPPAPPKTIAPTTASVTIVSQHPAAVQLMINGGIYQLAPGQVLPDVAIVASPEGHDIVEIRMATALPCGLGDSMDYFDAGGSYRFTVAIAPGVCDLNGSAQFNFTVTPA